MTVILAGYIDRATRLLYLVYEVTVLHIESGRRKFPHVKVAPGTGQAEIEAAGIAHVVAEFGGHAEVGD